MKTTCILATIAAAALLPRPAAAQNNFSTLLTFTDAAPVQLTPVDGILYGISDGLAPNGASCGTVFQVNPPSAPRQPWTQTVLYSFAATNDVCNPAGPVAYAGGNLYGLSVQGGANIWGGFFELQPPSGPGGVWTETVLYNFDLDGLLPADFVLLAGPGGSFYLPANAYPYGALAQFQPPIAPGGSWTLAELYSYPEDPGGGAYLIHGPGGVLYGASVTSYTTSQELGAAVQLTPPAAPGQSWTDTLLYSFGPLRRDAVSSPMWLTLGSGGVLYGMAAGGDGSLGTQGRGGVYSLAPPASPGGAWTYTLLEDFGPLRPCTPLTLYKGSLYGGVANHSYTSGAIFKLAPPSAPGGEWTLTYLHEFIGQVPDGALVVGGDGALYGTSAAIGPGEAYTGTVFRIAVE